MKVGEGEIIKGELFIKGVKRDRKNEADKEWLDYKNKVAILKARCLGRPH